VWCRQAPTRRLRPGRPDGWRCRHPSPEAQEWNDPALDVRPPRADGSPGRARPGRDGKPGRAEVPPEQAGARSQQAVPAGASERAQDVCRGHPESVPPAQRPGERESVKSHGHGPRQGRTARHARERGRQEAVSVSLPGRVTPHWRRAEAAVLRVRLRGPAARYVVPPERDSPGGWEVERAPPERRRPERARGRGSARGRVSARGRGSARGMQRPAPGMQPRSRQPGRPRRPKRRRLPKRRRRRGGALRGRPSAGRDPPADPRWRRSGFWRRSRGTAPDPAPLCWLVRAPWPARTPESSSASC
jgi:hypothetical protein